MNRWLYIGEAEGTSMGMPRAPRVEDVPLGEFVEDIIWGETPSKRRSSAWRLR